MHLTKRLKKAKKKVQKKEKKLLTNLRKDVILITCNAEESSARNDL